MNEPNVVQKFIWIGERAILLLIAVATLFATASEIVRIIEVETVNLSDLFLLFIYIKNSINISYKVLFINMEEPWVRKLTQGVNIEVIPTLVITLDGGGPKTLGFSGLEGITTALFDQFNVKKQRKR